ncbi:fumarylacetoacetate hydrolase family protein, partial [Escherichia coli]|uniref:fumarylacetoacetate hydrolase family protein n=2 Tax=Enterobacterales TaxID=91347 RepID=UPI002DB64F30
RKEFAETLDAPTLFVRFADSLTGHDSPLQKPATTQEFDYEGELAVIIGKAAHQVKAAEALDVVAGYSCFMDATVRDMQFTWFTAGKNWPQTGGFGPWMTTADEIPDPQQLAIKTFLNDREVQNDNTSSMVHPVAKIIEYISAFSPLSPGDVIITGSPGGVGKKRTPPLFMFSGDVIEVHIEKIGRLVNAIA